MEEIFDLLSLTDRLGNGTLSVICSQPGNFSKLWITIAKFLDKSFQKKLLLHGNETYLNLISTISTFGSKFDIASIVKVLLELFSKEELKKILTGQYPGFKKLLLHSALKFSEQKMLDGFWDAAIQSSFPNKRDQKDILLAEGHHNQKILYEGILEASKIGIECVLDKMKNLLTAEEIMTCLIDGHEQS